MQGLVAGARQAGIALVDLGEGIADLEVGEVVGSGQPARHLVAQWVGLGREVFPLDKSAEGLGVSEVDVLALVHTWEDGLVGAAGDESVESGVLGQDTYFLLEGMSEGELVFRTGRRDRAWALRFQTG